MLVGACYSIMTLGKMLPTPAPLFIINSRLDNASKNKIKIAAENFSDVSFIPAEISYFYNLPKLQNSALPYQKLIVPKFINSDFIVYLDCDTIVNGNIFEYITVNTIQRPLAAVATHKTKWRFDKDTLLEYGHLDDQYCFNSGVLIYNTELWKKHDICKKNIQHVREFSSKLRSHDETFLNLRFPDFQKLSADLNILIPPLRDSYADQIPSGILHFIGSPKPWEFMSYRYSKSAAVYERVLFDLGIKFQRKKIPSDLHQIIRLATKEIKK